MKHFISAGLLTLAMLTSCEWIDAIGGDDEPEMTHADSIHQQLLNLISQHGINGAYYYQPDGEVAGMYYDQPEEWFEDGFQAAFSLGVSEDSLINHYRVIRGDTTYARIPVAYSDIETVQAGRKYPCEEADRALLIMEVALNKRLDLKHVPF
jgi:hypothetical protein